MNSYRVHTIDPINLCKHIHVYANYIQTIYITLAFHPHLIIANSLIVQHWSLHIKPLKIDWQIDRQAQTHTHACAHTHTHIHRRTVNYGHTPSLPTKITQLV
jgi:hypothetical protein